MRITPIDIQEQKFKVSFRGYDKDEVDNFLDAVATQMEDLLRENSFIKEELDRLTKEVEHLKAMEDTLKDTIISAQKMSEDFKETARREAENIVAEARVRAEKILFDAEKRVSELNSELAKISGKAVEIRETVKAMFSSFLENIEKVTKIER
ncbi:MAG: DivIVA domain-containing protein [bacterium]